MESESKNQNDLLQQLKSLRAEKELLEKHVFVLNECLSVEELKSKISNLEKKKEMLVSLESVIGRLRAEIEPLKYLKSILNTKLGDENKIQSINIESELDNVLEACAEIEPLKPLNTMLKTKSDVEDKSQSDSNWSEISDSEPFMPPYYEKSHNNSSVGVQVVQPVEFKNYCSQSAQNIPTDSGKFKLALYPKLKNDKPIDTLHTTIPSTSNLVTTVSDGNLDECMQLLDQYDVVTDQEILNFPTEENDLKSQSVDQEPVKIDIIDTKNKLQNTQIETTETSCFDAGDNLQFKNQTVPTEDGDLEKALNNLKFIAEVSSKKHNKKNKSKTFKKEVNKFINEYTNLLQNSSQTIEKNNVSSEQTESTQDNELPPIAYNSECNKNSFNDMNLKIDILRGIYSLGFVNPTALQQRIVVHCINGRDIIVFAGPGNGRTMMFTIPLLQRIQTNLNECQALVLVPTRDLAVHIQKIIMSVGDFLGVNVCIGGDNVPRKLSVVPHVVVGTPAGVSNMISCKSLRIENIQTVVINKAEKMLTNNYTILIEEIMKRLTKTRQVTLLTSDKLDHVLDIYMESLRDPLVIINDQEKEYDLQKNLPKQFYLNIQKEWKMNALCEINETLKVQRSIIFCNTLDRAQKLCESLQRLEYGVSLFHLEMNAHEREQKLAMFSSNIIKMFITTDPIKGSQFQQATFIINYDLPINPICYLDRVAKCAENIKVINLIDEDDDQTKLAIETHNKSYMIQMPLNMIDMLQY